MANVEQETVLQLQRRFEAPRERVFDAWTNPEVLREWWAAMPTMSPGEIDVDLREGGRYRMQMRTDTGEVHTVVGEYKEVRLPERIAYTWTWESKDVAKTATHVAHRPIAYARKGSPSEDAESPAARGSRCKRRYATAGALTLAT